jgi:hypothetical protein
MASAAGVKVGSSREVWTRWKRPNRKDNTEQVYLTPTVNTVVTTAPDGTATTTLIGAMRATEATTRYAFTQTFTAAGTWRFKATGSGTYTDDDGNTINWSEIQTWDVRVDP